MSSKHPIIAVTGSSGAGTSIAKDAFAYMFRKHGIKAAMIEGDCFHRYERAEMERQSAEAEAKGRRLTHFGPEGLRNWRACLRNTGKKARAGGVFIFTMKKRPRNTAIRRAP